MPTVTIPDSHLSARVSISITQDAAGNKSTLRVDGLELRNEWGEIGSAYVTGTISINGIRAAQLTLSNVAGCGVVFVKGSWCAVGLGAGAGLSPVTLTHGADGVCPPVSVSVSLRARNGAGTQDYGSAVGSGSLTVPTIPRVSEISASGVELGQAMEITLTRASEGFQDTLSWQCGEASGIIAEKTGETALSWTPPVSLAEANPQGTAVDVVLTVSTYSGETSVGSKSVTVSCPIPGSVVPTLEITVTDKTGCYDRYGSYVRTRSQARVQTTASGAYGSTVKSVSVSCGSLTASGEDAVFSLPDPGAVTVRVTVTDSRGRSAAAVETITVADYQNPSVSVTNLYRCGSDGTANPQGAFGKAVFTGSVTPLGGKNAAVYRLKKRIRGTETWTVSQISQGEAVFSAGVDDDWEVCISVSDDFTEVTGQVSVLPVAFSLLDFHRGSRSAGILQRASTPGAVDVGGDTVHHGHRIRDVGPPQDPDDAVTLRTLLDAVYPVGSVYLSTVETSPAIFLGGTWERIKDRFLLAAGDTYAPGEVGGEAEHTLTVDEIPSHQHGMKTTLDLSTAAGNRRNTVVGGGNAWSSNDTNQIQYTGGDQPHNNMPPYLAVYIWKRTA